MARARTRSAWRVPRTACSTSPGTTPPGRTPRTSSTRRSRRRARSAPPPRSRAGGPGSRTPRSSSTPAACARSGAAFARRTRATAARDEHRALAGWRRELGAPARLGQPARRAVVREQHAATVRGDGSTLQAFAGTLGTWVHAGLSPATPNHDFQAPLGPYGYDPNLATDASNRTVMAWYSNASPAPRRAVQDVAADGAPVGAAATMPDTGDMQVGMLGRTPLVARKGGGFYVAYPTGYPSVNRVRLWRVGAARRRWSGAWAARAARRWPSPPPATGGSGWSGRRASGTRTCWRGGRTRARRGSVRP